jgi:branched-chain amino acid transport system permease protein
MRLILFILSGFFAALGGGLVAYDVGMDPYVGMPMLLNAVVALIIGGMGRFEAPIIGGFIIGILQAMVVWAFSSRWQDAVTFTLLILFLLFRPQGLMGEKKRAV